MRLKIIIELIVIQANELNYLNVYSAMLTIRSLFHLRVSDCDLLGS